MIFKLDISSKRHTPSGVCLFWYAEVRFEDINATVRWTVAADGSTEAKLNFSSHREEKCKQIWPVLLLAQEIVMLLRISQ